MFLLKLSGGILGACGEVVIGNNVFIGMNTIILRNVHIGDNVVIGAGSVVSKDCESGWVYAGNPAKKIIRIEDYYDKRLKLQLDEAKLLATRYYDKFKKVPNKEVFHEFFMLFEKEPQNNNVFFNKMHLCENYDDSINYLNINKPLFESYEDFINYCLKDKY